MLKVIYLMSGPVLPGCTNKVIFSSFGFLAWLGSDYFTCLISEFVAFFCNCCDVCCKIDSTLTFMACLTVQSPHYHVKHSKSKIYFSPFFMSKKYLSPYSCIILTQLLLLFKLLRQFSCYSCSVEGNQNDYGA